MSLNLSQDYDASEVPAWSTETIAHKSNEMSVRYVLYANERIEELKGFESSNGNPKYVLHASKLTDDTTEKLKGHKLDSRDALMSVDEGILSDSEARHIVELKLQETMDVLRNYEAEIETIKQEAKSK